MVTQLSLSLATLLAFFALGKALAEPPHGVASGADAVVIVPMTQPVPSVVYGG